MALYEVWWRGWFFFLNSSKLVTMRGTCVNIIGPVWRSSWKYTQCAKTQIPHFVLRNQNIRIKCVKRVKLQVLVKMNMHQSCMFYIKQFVVCVRSLIHWHLVTSSPPGWGNTTPQWNFQPNWDRCGLGMSLQLALITDKVAILGTRLFVNLFKAQVMWNKQV